MEKKRTAHDGLKEERGVLVVEWRVTAEQDVHNDTSGPHVDSGIITATLENFRG